MDYNSPEYKAALKDILAKYKKSFMFAEFMFKSNLECIDCTVDDALDIKGEAKKLLETCKAMRSIMQEFKEEIKKVSKHAPRLP